MKTKQQVKNLVAVHISSSVDGDYTCMYLTNVNERYFFALPLTFYNKLCDPNILVDDHPSACVVETLSEHCYDLKTRLPDCELNGDLRINNIILKSSNNDWMSSNEARAKKLKELYTYDGVVRCINFSKKSKNSSVFDMQLFEY